MIIRCSTLQVAGATFLPAPNLRFMYLSQPYQETKAKLLYFREKCTRGIAPPPCTYGAPLFSLFEKGLCCTVREAT
jgi:hypothetical protein